MTDAIKITRPREALPLIFDSPHSGTVYPDDFPYACDMRDLERAEDKFVDDLFSAVPDHGGTLLCALFPRSYIDVNRAEDDIDPDIMNAAYPDPVRPSARSDAGIGLIRRLVRPGVPVYARALRPEEIRHRIEHYYRPYHDALHNLIEEAHYNFGHAWHINCHSMPATSARPRQPIGITKGRGQAADFVLGDRDGTSCDLALTHAIRDKLKSMGYIVAINDPFKGVELVSRYSNPSRGRHSLQIEVDKSLYMDEHKNVKIPGYNNLKADIETLIAFCAAYVRQELSLKLAAD